MPRKTTSPAVVAQNKECQRRSRARRKAFVEALQQRVQELESRGVEATVAMQQAARRVAAENTALRALLRQQGVSEETVSAHVATALAHAERGDAAATMESTEPSSVAADTPPPPAATMDIPCEEAAGILHGLRGDGSVEQLRQTLGCDGSSAACTVKRVRVFELLDSYV